MRPPVPYFGGKMMLADRIIESFPAHRHYVEPFCGSLAVLLAKAPSALETVNSTANSLMLSSHARRPWSYPGTTPRCTTTCMPDGTASTSPWHPPKDQRAAPRSEVLWVNRDATGPDLFDFLEQVS